MARPLALGGDCDREALLSTAPRTSIPHTYVRTYERHALCVTRTVIALSLSHVPMPCLRLLLLLLLPKKQLVETQDHLRGKTNGFLSSTPLNLPFACTHAGMHTAHLVINNFVPFGRCWSACSAHHHPCMHHHHLFSSFSPLPALCSCPSAKYLCRPPGCPQLSACLPAKSTSRPKPKSSKFS